MFKVNLPAARHQLHTHEVAIIVGSAVNAEALPL
jgi:hypothetical protein